MTSLVGGAGGVWLSHSSWHVRMLVADEEGEALVKMRLIALALILGALALQLLEARGAQAPDIRGALLIGAGLILLYDLIRTRSQQEARSSPE